MTTISPYTPNFLDALKVFWSLIWRSTIISLLFLFALILLGGFIKLIGLSAILPPPPFALNEHGQLIFTYTPPLSIICFQVTSFVFQLIVNFFAFKELIKAKYATFVFDYPQITSYQIFTFVFMMNAFDMVFSYFAGSRLQSFIASFLFVSIQLFVKCALIQHVMSSGFFTGKWRVSLPVLTREGD